MSVGRASEERAAPRLRSEGLQGQQLEHKQQTHESFSKTVGIIRMPPNMAHNPHLSQSNTPPMCSFGTGNPVSKHRCKLMSFVDNSLSLTDC